MHRMSRVPYRVIARDWWLRLSYPLLAMTLRLRHILANDKMHMTRLMIGASSLTWASILLGPSQVFNDNIVIYLVMRVLMSENVWGLLFLISGLVSIYSVLMDVRNRVTIYLDALLGAFLWSASTVCCFLAHWCLRILAPTSCGCF